MESRVNDPRWVFKRKDLTKKSRYTFTVPSQAAAVAKQGVRMREAKNV